MLPSAKAALADNNSTTEKPAQAFHSTDFSECSRSSVSLCPTATLKVGAGCGPGNAPDAKKDPIGANRNSGRTADQLVVCAKNWASPKISAELGGWIDCHSNVVERALPAAGCRNSKTALESSLALMSIPVAARLAS